MRSKHLLRSLIFKKISRGEADELVIFLSRDLGWLRGVAKNAKKSRVRFGGHLESFSLVDLTLRPRRKDDLVWIADSQVIEGFLGLRRDIVKVAWASYLFELSWLFSLEGNPDERVFDFLSGFAADLSDFDFHATAMIVDEIRLLGLLGYAPVLDKCVNCGQPIEPGQEGRFEAGSGGVCHTDCLTSPESGMPLSPETLAVVQRGLELERRHASRLRLNRKGREEMRVVLSSFVRNMSGREISSLVFLEKIQ